MIRRITALAVLAGLLALPALGMAASDSCCAGDSACAPGGTRCESLGPVPCCPADHGVSGSVESRTAGAPIVCALAESRPVEIERASSGMRFDRLAVRGATSPLRLSVVLRL